MAGAFEAARDVLFANEDRAEDAQYFESEEDDEPQALRVIRDVTEPDAGLFRTDAFVPGDKIWVSQSSLVAQPPEDSFFIVGDRKLVVRTAVTAALDGSWWICDVDARSIGS